MKCDLDGLARKLKCALKGPDRKELAFMVDELVRNLRERAAEIERLKALLAACVQANDDCDYYNDSVWEPAREAADAAACDHPRHRNPGLTTPCPECGAGG